MVDFHRPRVTNAFLRLLMFTAFDGLYGNIKMVSPVVYTMKADKEKEGQLCYVIA